MRYVLLIILVVYNRLDKNLNTERRKHYMFRRDKYLNELIQRRKNGQVKVITGLRRSGKSYLMMFEPEKVIVSAIF